MKKGLKAERRRGLLLSFATLGLVATVAVVPTFRSTANVVQQEIASRTQSHVPGIENYDIRTDKDASAAQALLDYRAASGKTSAIVESNRKGFANGESALRTSVPTLKVEYNDDIQTPEVIAPDLKQGRHFLTGSTSGKRSDVLVNFLKQNSELVGMNDAQLDRLKVATDYTNPDGNLSFVELTQEINGIPVFRGEVKAGFTKRGEMFRVINNLAPNMEYDSLSTNFGSPEEGVRAAFNHVGRKITAEDTQRNDAASNDLKVTFGGGDWGTTAEKMYFPTEPGVARAAWRILVWEPVSAYYVIVDAETGKMLWRKNITQDQTQPATYNVYANTTSNLKTLDNPAPLTPGPVSPTAGTQGAIVPRTNVTLIGNEAPYTFNQKGWMTDGTNITDGNNVESGIDRVAPNGVDAPVTGVARVFNFNYNPGPGNPAPGDDPLTPEYQRGAVTHQFYSVNRYHDEMYLLGFTEAARNFQNENFTGQGVGNDRVSGEAQDSSGTNNANFATPADGGRGRMQMFLWTGPTPDRDGDLDTEIIVHELTHGTSNRLHGNSAGLGTNMSQGMGEGWGDYYGHSLLSEPTDPINGIYTTGGYSTYQLASATDFSNYYYGIRRFPKAVKAFTGGPNNRPHNPLIFSHLNADCNTAIGSTTTAPISAFPRGPVGAAQCDQVHNAGEIWSTALWEARAKFVARLGAVDGNKRMMQFVLDGMKLAPLNPTFLTERDAIIAAAQASSVAPEAALDVSDLWAGFALRGMGFSARITSIGSPAVVVDGFDLPNAVINQAGVTVSDAPPGGDGDGFPEPGETLTITIPVTNNSGATINNLTVAITGGGTANFGTLANGASATATATFLVPTNTTCGGLLTLTFNLSSSVGGPNTSTKEIRIGAPVGGAPATFSNTAAITINDNAPATPYPSNITVSGLTGNKTIKLNLNGFTHTFPGDVDVLLVGPGGQKFLPMSDMGGAGDVSAINLVLTDTATETLSTSQLVAGTFKPGNTDTTSDVFPAPAPAAPYDSPAPGGTATFASTFGTNGAAMNGTWSLYVRDDAGTDTGSIAGGWGLTFESNDFACGPNSSGVRSDFDGDGRSDRAVFRSGQWYAQRSTAGFVSQSWGASTDTPVSGDFDGDGKTDFATFRPTSSPDTTPDFFILQSSNNTARYVAWGQADDIPVVGDFDGDNKDDVAIWRGTSGLWAIKPTNNSAPIYYTFGQNSDRPIVADYDGDNKDDVAVYRGGTWYMIGSTIGYKSQQWGVAGDSVVPGDYDGDAKADLAVWRPEEGRWYILRSQTNTPQTIVFGQIGDQVAPGDYDGDGKMDVGVFRSGVWYTLGSTSGFSGFNFGQGGDTPIESLHTR